MIPVVTVDATEFQSALRQYLATTKRTLEDATNSRLFFLLTRAFVLLKPHDPQSERNRINAYMRTQIGERRFDKRTGKKVGKSRLFERRHKIAQMREKRAGRKGLYGEEMKIAAAKLLRQSVGSVGYMKSVVAKAIKQISGHFTQFGYKTKKSGGKDISGNAAAIKFAAEYGTVMSNVGMHRGGRAYTTKARPGFSPFALADMALQIADDQASRVKSRYDEAFSRAFRDETAELNRQLAIRMQADIDQYSAVKAK